MEFLSVVSYYFLSGDLLSFFLLTGHWVRKCFVQCRRLIMRLPAMLIRIAVWAFSAKTQTSLFMTGLLKMKYYLLDFVGL